MSNERYLDPPDDDDPRCECGVLQSEHGNAPDAKAMKKALEEIEQYVRWAPSHIPAYEIRMHVLGEVERGLRVVADENSDCRKFVAADPGDDCDARLDARRGT